MATSAAPTNQKNDPTAWKEVLFILTCLILSPILVPVWIFGAGVVFTIKTLSILFGFEDRQHRKRIAS